MDAFLHIGMPKTGSTALQETLLASHEALLARGVLYPRVPDPSFNNHRLLLVGTTGLRRLPRHIRRGYTEPELEARKAEFLRATRAALRGHDPRALVLSAESLFRNFSAEGQRVLMAGLGKIGVRPDNTTVVAYVRRPADRYLSGLQQHLKASWKVAPPEPAHYRANLEQYEQLFGNKALSVVPFRREALAGADIVTDFLARFLAPWGVERAAMAPVGAVNETLSAEGVDIQRAYRETFHREDDDRHTPDSLRMFKALQEIDGELGMARPRLAGGIADLVDYAAADPLWMRDRFGVEFPDFDYARLERGDLAVPPERAWRLDELMAIDRTRQAAMLARLAAHRICADPARAAFVARMQAGLGLPRAAAVPAGLPAAPPEPPVITRVTGSTTMTDAKPKKPVSEERALLTAVAKALWKAEQKAANPAIAPEALKTGWAAARQTRIEETRLLLKAVSKAGFRLVKTEAAAGAEPPEA